MKHLLVRIIPPLVRPDVLLICHRVIMIMNCAFDDVKKPDTRVFPLFLYLPDPTAILFPQLIILQMAQQSAACHNKERPKYESRFDSGKGTFLPIFQARQREFEIRVQEKFVYPFKKCIRILKLFKHTKASV